MANINIYDLQPAGFGLFSDSESYMRELSENELAIQGGGWFRDALSFIGSVVWDAVKTYIDPADRSKISKRIETWV